MSRLLLAMELSNGNSENEWHHEDCRGVITTEFEEYEKVRIPAKGITGTIIDIYVESDGVAYYTVENEQWGDVDDPDAWNIGYAQFICTEEQLVHAEEP